MYHEFFWFYEYFYLRLIEWSNGNGEWTREPVIGYDWLVVNAIAFRPALWILFIENDQWTFQELFLITQYQNLILL